MDLSPQDRDMMVRTVIGEAAGQPDEGQAAVAHVILNRSQNPQWGGSPSQVVLAPNQFEPWSTRSKQLMAIDPNSPEYQHAAQIVDGAVAGEIPDPTNGATYFLNPDIVKARRGGTLPSWAQGPGQKIGQHVFYGGKAPQMAQNDIGPVSDADIAQTAAELGIKLPAGSPAAAPVAAAAGAPVDGTVNAQDIVDTAKELGIKLTPPKSAAASPDVQPSSTPGVPTKITVRPPGNYGLNLQNQVAEGMPLVGPAMNKLQALIAAGVIQPGFKMLGTTPVGMSNAPSFGERYSSNLADITNQNKQFAAANPVASTVANLTGGAMALGPLAEAAPGLMGMPGRFTFNLPTRMIGGTIGGGGIGAGDAALRGDSPYSGAVWGGAGGMAGPMVGEAARGGAGWLLNNALKATGPLRDLATGTVQRLVNAFEGETPASIQAGMKKAGPQGFLADIAPGMTDLAGGVADISGPGKTTVREAYRQRQAGHRARVDQAATDAFQVPGGVNVENFRQWLEETRAAAADPLYTQWRKMQVQPTDKLKDLLPRLEASGALDLAQESAAITGKPFNKKFFTPGPQKEYPTTESWDLAKRGLDRRIDKAYRDGDKKHAADLIQLKNDMLGEIEKTPAGKVWQQARREFAERSAIIDQLEAGKDTFLGGRSGTSVDEMRNELTGLSGPEKMARIVGARKAVSEAMGAAENGDVSMRNKLLAPNNKEKLELLLGKPKADKLIESLEQEKFLAEQGSNVVGNMQTGASASMRSERRRALETPQMQPWDFDFAKPMTWLPPSMREGFTLHGIVNAYKGQEGARVANQLAPLLVSRTGSPQTADLVKAIQAEALRRAGNARRAAGLGGPLSFLVSGPGATTARRQVPTSQ